MADNTVTLQNTFTSDGLNRVIQIPSGVDWMRVFNRTAAAQAAADLAYEFYWQRGYTQGTGDVWTKLGTVANDPVTVGALAAPLGFYLYENSDQGIARLGSAVAITATTASTTPVFSTATTTGLTANSTIVRVYNLATGQAINGLDFTVGTVNAGVNFTTAVALATSTTTVGGAGSYRIVNYDPLFYPPFRYIFNITQANGAVVRLSVPSGYAVGQKVQFIIPSLYGMVELNQMTATITAVNNAGGTQTITVDTDTSAFTAFITPTNALAVNGVTRAIVIPDGMDTGYAIAQSVNPLSGSINNTGVLGMLLPGGAASPGGATSDVMYWQAGRVFSSN